MEVQRCAFTPCFTEHMQHTVESAEHKDCCSHTTTAKHHSCQPGHSCNSAHFNVLPPHSEVGIAHYSALVPLERWQAGRLSRSSPPLWRPPRV